MVFKEVIAFLDFFNKMLTVDLASYYWTGHAQIIVKAIIKV